MGRHKKEENVESEDTKVTKEGTVEATINKIFGENILVNAQYILDKKNIIIPVSPSIDSITGGIPEGTWFTLTGHPKSGKSSVALDFSATAQNPKYGGDTSPEGREVYFYAIEGRLKERDIVGIPHLVRERFHIIQSKPGKILNASDYLEIAENLINSKPGSVHIIDSYSALCTDAEKSGTMADQQRADGAKLLAKFCRKLCNVIPVNRNIIVGITHLMGNPTGYSEWKEKSGQAISYQADVKLKCIGTRAWSLTNGQQIVQESDWLCLNTALYIPPGQKATTYLRYGFGIDKNKELCDIAVDLGLIIKSGMWYKFPMLNNQTAQGIEKATELLKNSPKTYDEIYDKVKEMLGMKI